MGSVVRLFVWVIKITLVLGTMDLEVQAASNAVAEAEKAARENKSNSEKQTAEVFCKARKKIIIVESQALANKDMRKALQKIANAFHHQLD